MQFSISLSQVNSKGQTTFNANAKNVKAESIKDVSKLIANFSIDTVKTFDKLASLGVKGLSANRIKSSQPIFITLTAKDSVSFTIANFGQVIRDNKQKDVETIIELVAVHADKYATIWS